MEQMRVFLRVAALAAFAMLASGCNHTAPPTPLNQLNVQQMRGRAVFEARCATCHADRTNAKLHGPSMLGVFKKPYLPSGAPANDDRVTDTILHGHGLMPAMGNTMDQQDINDLLAYLHTL